MSRAAARFNLASMTPPARPHPRRPDQTFCISGCKKVAAATAAVNAAVARIPVAILEKKKTPA
jgi:hypothetical protein